MKYSRIGWCKEDSHDKIWGIIRITNNQDSDYWTPDKYVTFWGRRGKKLQTKTVEGHKWYADRLFEEKTDKGYKELNQDELDKVYPEFEKDLQKTVVWAMLKG